jgi:hypothetical protein
MMAASVPGTVTLRPEERAMGAVEKGISGFK